MLAVGSERGLRCGGRRFSATPWSPPVGSLRIECRGDAQEKKGTVKSLCLAAPCRPHGHRPGTTRRSSS